MLARWLGCGGRREESNGKSLSRRVHNLVEEKNVCVCVRAHARVCDIRQKMTKAPRESGKAFWKFKRRVEGGFCDVRGCYKQNEKAQR